MKKPTRRVLSLAPATPGEPLLTEGDVARLLRISPRHVQRLLIPFVNLGTGKRKCRRFRPVDVHNWLAEQIERRQA